MAAKIQLNKEALKKYSIPYELFPTESGVTKPQILHIYDTCLYLKYDINIEFTNLNEDDEQVKDGFILNKVIFLGKESIADLTIEEHNLMQIDDNGKEVEYSRPGITISTICGGYQLWFDSFEKAVEVFNDLINWRYA